MSAWDKLRIFPAARRRKGLNAPPPKEILAPSDPFGLAQGKERPCRQGCRRSQSTLHTLDSAIHLSPSTQPHASRFTLPAPRSPLPTSRFTLHASRSTLHASLQRAFSLLEMMVVISLLTVIVLGLYAMFDQTQRALRSNTAQVDVLEPGRAALDLISRQLEQITAAGFVATNYAVTNLVLRYPSLTQLHQSLIDGTARTNVLQECFFLIRSNHWWMGDGFFVATVANGVLDPTFPSKIGAGTLFRFSPTNLPPVRRLAPGYLANAERAFNQAKGNIRMAFPVIDGVVHFRVRPLDSMGQFITLSQTTNVVLGQVHLKDPLGKPPGGSWEWIYTFRNDRVPSFLDLELGVLEPQVLAKANSLPGTDNQKKFLQQQAGAVHLFHKLIPLRIVQP